MENISLTLLCTKLLVAIRFVYKLWTLIKFWVCLRLCSTFVDVIKLFLLYCQSESSILFPNIDASRLYYKSPFFFMQWFKGTVSVFSCDLPSNDGNAALSTTVPCLIKCESMISIFFSCNYLFSFAGSLRKWLRSSCWGKAMEKI